MKHLLPFATPRQAEVIEAVIQYGSQRKAAKVLGIHHSNVHRNVQAAKARAARQGVAPEADMVHQAPEGFTVQGTSTLYKDGEPVIQWVKTNQEKQSMMEMLEEFKEGLANLAKSKPIKPPKTSNKDYLAAYIIGDHHFGMYAWGEETGGSDWDTDKSKEVLMNAIDRLVCRAGDAHTALLVNVGDFFHANDTTATTPSSKHLLDTDGRFGRTIRIAGELFRYLIERLLNCHKEVVIINARGNHDPDAALWINEMLRMYYLDEKRITVLDNFNKFVWYKFGKNLIVTHHGDRLKIQQAYEAITRNLPKEWGECDHRFLWMGHIHHKQQHEVGGMLAESFNVLAPPDAWHSSSGYGAHRSMTCILLHKDYGLDCRFQANIQELI